MNRTLQLIFLNESGTRITVSIPDPREDLLQAEVEVAMDEIIAADVIVSNGGGLVSKVAARVVSRETEELAVF
jgi:hypothetical protein